MSASPTTPKRSPSSSIQPQLRLQPTRLALVQLGQTSTDKSFNITHAREAIVRAATQDGGADMVVLPECWNSPYGVQYFNEYAEDFGGLWERIKRPIDRRGSRSRDRDDDEMDEAAKQGQAEEALLQRWGVDGLGGAALEIDAEACKSESIKFMSGIARELGIVLVGGSIPERVVKDGKLFNTATVFDQKGRLISIHRKVSHDSEMMEKQAFSQR